MPEVVHEDCFTPLPDGVRTLFYTRAPYVPLSVRVFVNGALVRGDYIEGWVEEGGNRVRMRVPPRSSDHLTFYYRPA